MSKSLTFNNVVSANLAALQTFKRGNRVVIKPQEKELQSLDVFSQFSLAIKDSTVLVASGVGDETKLSYVLASDITDSSEIVGKISFTSVGNSDFKGVLSLGNETRRKLVKTYLIGLTLSPDKKAIVARVLGVDNGAKWSPEKDCSAWGVVVGAGKLAVEFKDLLNGKDKKAWKWNRDLKACEKTTQEETPAR